jgi:hypothetical protein
VHWSNKKVVLASPHLSAVWTSWHTAWDFLRSLLYVLRPKP